MKRKFSLLIADLVVFAVVIFTLVTSSLYFDHSQFIVVIFSIIFIAGLTSLSIHFVSNLIIKNHEIKTLQNLNTKIVSELDQQKYQLRNLFDNANFAIAYLDLNGKVTLANHIFCSLLGYSRDDIANVNIQSILANDAWVDLQKNMQKLVNKKINNYHSEHQCFCKNGENLWIALGLSLIFNEFGHPESYLLQIQNISMQKKAEERLGHMAYHDSLTSLPNRNKLEQFVSLILASARRNQQSFAVIFMDLDRFKNINDTIGHDAGDTLLQIVGERLVSTVRASDLVARLGGDEFVIVVTDVKVTESVALIAQKILDVVMKAIVINGKEIYITTSIGISLFPHDGQNMQSLMRNADLALYKAKDLGRNNYQFYTSEMTNKAISKMQLQNAIGHALAKKEFSLNYQPKMCLKNRKITGIEALLRWSNLEFGAITPDKIISLAEETGLIIPVSEWILASACKSLMLWREMGFSEISMAVNCSGRQFKQTSFVTNVSRLLTEMMIPAHLLEVEVTEGLILQDPKNILRELYALKDMGVKIVIDDFGTGYWSIGNMKRIAVDKIKIDKSFIKQVIEDETSASITTAIIAMANRMGITSIAEGVETREQYEFLVKEGCDEIQGYYLTSALPHHAMTNFLRHPVPDAEKISQTEIMT